MMVLSACGGGTSGGSQQSGGLSGNWQFSIFQNTADLTQNSGLQGGFLLQNNNDPAAGEMVYSNTLAGQLLPCNSGSATITQTSGPSITFTVAAGGQTYTLTGKMNSDGSMSGSYTATPGPTVMVNGTPTVCGEGITGTQTPLSWTAIPVPSLTGSITGSFHSGGTGDGSKANQDFPVTGSLVQGANIGASSANVTGTLSFIDPTTGLSDYPCFPGGTVSVNGQISGNTAILQLKGTDGSSDGQIGIAASQAGLNGMDLQPVTLDSAAGGGYVLHSTGQGYQVITKPCPAVGTTAQEVGYICLALNGTTACQEPVTLSPALVTFPAQILNAGQRQRQVVTLTNNFGSTLSGLTLAFGYDGDSGEFGSGGYTDFNGLPSFQAEDTCAQGGETLPSSGSGTPFDLNAGASCTIAVSFTPQEGCPWLPYPQPGVGQSIGGASPQYCPFPQSATLTVQNVASADLDTSFLVPITGSGVSAILPSTPELDFGAEEQFSPPEASLPQTLSFTNFSAYPVQILGSVPCVDPWILNGNGIEVERTLTLPHPLLTSGQASGLQVVDEQGMPSLSAVSGSTPPTIYYTCDSDFVTAKPSFQISSDTCSGSLLAPQASCSLEVAYVPQPNAPAPNSGGVPSGGLDYFLELNTLQCWPAGTLPSESNPCEIDSGRFPVELKANGPSPLRMSPGAGMDFGTQTKGTVSAPLSVTLLNDPSLTSPPYPQAITFVGNIQVTGNYAIPSGGNSCPPTLAPGDSCTISVTFKPGSVGLNTGQLTINYTSEPFTGKGQIVYLRGTGQ